MSVKTDIWNILGIDKTNDKSVIKKAYLKKLKFNNPEDNPEDFMRLRDAYEAAISGCQYDYEDDYTDMEDEEYNYREKELSPEEIIMKEKLEGWISKVDETYVNLEKRFDIKYWHELLYNDIPMCIRYYDECYGLLDDTLVDFIISSHKFVPDNITRMINDFFSYSGGDIERTMQGRIWQREINKKMKLNENIRFDLIDSSVAGEKLDNFFRNYNKMIEEIIKRMEYVKKINYTIDNKLLKYVLKYEDEIKEVFYLPFEVMRLNNSFDSMTDDEIKDSIEKLQTEAWNRLSGNVINKGREDELKNSIFMEISLLNAEYLIHKNNIREAVKLIDELYQKLPLKDLMYLYRLSALLNKSGKHYEEYRCLYVLTYLNPRPEIFSMLKKIRDGIIAEYENAQTKDKPYTNIQMCRMYLHDDEVFKAYDRIKNTRGRKSFKYYAVLYMTAVDADYYKTECKVYEKLEQSDKTKLKAVELLEWEEIQTIRMFREEKFVEAIERCNKLLEEYPNAYNFNLLRIAIQTSYNYLLTRYKNYSENNLDIYKLPYGMVMYENIGELIVQNPMGARARIISASRLQEKRCNKQNERALSILEPVKDKYPHHYKFVELMLFYSKNFKKYAEESLKFLKDNRYIRLNMPLGRSALSIYTMFRDYSDVFAKMDLSYDEKREYANNLFYFIDYKYNIDEFERHAEYAYDLARYPQKFTDCYENYLVSANAIIEYCDEEEREHFRHGLLCSALIYNDRIEEAEKIMEEGDDSYKSDLYNAIGIMYSQKKDYEKKLKYYKLAVKYAKVRNANVTYSNLANTYAGNGEYKKAIEVLEELDERYGLDAECLMLVSDIYKKADDFDNAEKYLDKAYEYAGYESYNYILNRYHARKAEIYLNKGEIESAVREYEKADEAGIDKYYLDNYYRCLMIVGQYEKAAEICCDNYIREGKNTDEFMALVRVKTFLNMENISCSKIIDDILSEDNIKYCLEHFIEFVQKDNNMTALIYMTLIYNLLDKDENVDKCLKYMADNIDKHEENHHYKRCKATVMAKRGNLEEAVRLCGEIDYDNIQDKKNVYNYYSHTERLMYKRMLDEQKGNYRNDIRN